MARDSSLLFVAGLQLQSTHQLVIGLVFERKQIPRYPRELPNPQSFARRHVSQVQGDANLSLLPWIVPCKIKLTPRARATWSRGGPAPENFSVAADEARCTSCN